MVASHEPKISYGLLDKHLIIILLTFVVTLIDQVGMHSNMLICTCMYACSAGSH